MRSGRNHHANLNEEVNELLGEDLKAFNLEEVQCDALDDLINQHLKSSILDCGVPKNIKEAMESQEAMEAAKKEIDMIKKFKMWKLIDPLEVPSGIPIQSCDIRMDHVLIASYQIWSNLH